MTDGKIITITYRIIEQIDFEQLIRMNINILKVYTCAFFHIDLFNSS